jgi:transposase InsO family protein
MPSDRKKRKDTIKAKIQDIYDDSKQNYGAPKITQKLRQDGEIIVERTISVTFEALQLYEKGIPIIKELKKSIKKSSDLLASFVRQLTREDISYTEKHLLLKHLRIYYITNL